VSLVGTVVQTDQTNTYGSFAQTFPFDTLFIQNPPKVRGEVEAIGEPCCA